MWYLNTSITEIYLPNAKWAQVHHDLFFYSYEVDFRGENGVLVTGQGVQFIGCPLSRTPRMSLP